MTTANTITCGPLRISGDFDTGNVLRAELTYPAERKDSTSSIELSPSSFQLENQDYEINVWTRPDCYGTPFENGNRTWFHFGINGGKSNGVVKINIVNLNKQTKLFLQGMQPVIRVMPDKPKWERISDRIVVNENKPQENGCSISFRLKLPDNPNKSTLYIAFTYPFGYLELCDVLKTLDDEFLKKILKGGSKLKSNIRRELWLNPSSENDIYYHRECVCYSLEGRRVDLVTISSTHGISEKREERLGNLFPILEEPRPFKFPGKKVVFLSARVHPGETPSSFVLNGFLRFILQKTDPRAVILRRLFVIKFIPILNPDGVYKGHYRTDPRGVNLNRVYLNPSLKLHPSIYAARKLLIYYHCGVDVVDEPEESTENVLPNPDFTNSSIESCNSDVDVASPSCSRSCTKVESREICREPGLELFSEDACFDTMQVDHGSLNPHNDVDKASIATSSKKPYTFVLSDANSLCAGCVPLEDANENAPCSLHHASTSGTQGSGQFDSLNDSISHQCAFEACDEDSVNYENLKLNDPVHSKMEVDQDVDLESSISSNSEKQSSRPNSPRRKKKGSAKDRKKTVSEPPKSKRLASTGLGLFKTSRDSSVPAVFSSKKMPYEVKGSRLTRSQKNNTSTYKNMCTSRYFDSSSGLFFYVDMHGHTTKRGIFMYGNHFPDISTQAECMIVPRVMAINSPHFDFAACNFTERLMCVKDKKDGLSREGSGRVACLKLTGLVRSYTLECNYNTGRIVNQIVARSPTSGIVDNADCAVFQPPKYTIELFEGVGRALAETVLDMSGQNPYSRLNLTEFKTIEGVKRSLVSRLRLSPEFKASASLLGASTALDSNANPLPLGTKLPRKAKPKNFTPVAPSSGPLGPKNRENQNTENAKPSGSQTKKLPNKQLTLSSDDSGGVGTSSALEKSSVPPKSKLTKVMKKKSFPRVSSASKIKGKSSRKSERSDSLPN